MDVDAIGAKIYLKRRGIVSMELLNFITNINLEISNYSRLL